MVRAPLLLLSWWGRGVSVSTSRRAGASALGSLDCRRGLAGHNKWSKIKRKKGAKDGARSAQFSKATRAIISASRACGGDMSNLRLQSAIAHAKNIQVPKDRIEDAVAKHAQEQQQSDVDTVSLRYDAMMSFDGTKVACLLTTLTDNHKRTASSVRATVSKSGGELLPTAAHDYLFRRVGMVLLQGIDDDDDDDNNNKEDTLWECAMEAGATDVDMDDDNKEAVVVCESSDLATLVQSLREAGLEPTEFDHRYVLTDPEMGSVVLSHQGQERLNVFLDKCEENMDITNVFHNAVVPDMNEE